MSAVAELELDETLEAELAFEAALPELAEETEVVKDTAKHKRVTAYITNSYGEQVLAERVWGYCLIPVAEVREFAQFCRDTDRKINDVVGPIIAGGIEDLFEHEIIPTADERAEARAVKALPNTEEALVKQVEKLEAKQQAVADKLAAVKARAAALRASTVTVVSDQSVAEVLGKNGKVQAHKGR